MKKIIVFPMAPQTPPPQCNGFTIINHMNVIFVAEWDSATTEQGDGDRRHVSRIYIQNNKTPRQINVRP